MCDIVLTSWAIYQEKYYMLVSFHISMTETSISKCSYIFNHLGYRRVREITLSRRNTMISL